MEEYEIEVRVDGEETSVTLSQPQGLEYLHTVATMPDNLYNAEPSDDWSLQPEDVDWMRVLFKRVTDLEEEELDNIHPDDVRELLNASCHVMAGDRPPQDTDEFRVDEDESPISGLELDEDGTIETEDMR